MGKYVRGNVEERLDLATLASKDVLSVLFDETVIEQMRISSLDARYTLSGYTPQDSDGPIMIGIAHSDYLDSEIEEWIEATGSWNPWDLSEQERSKRLIRRVGIFEAPATVGENAVLNGGRNIKTKLNWSLATGQTLRLWAYNMGNAGLTTGAEIMAMGNANLWRK